MALAGITVSSEASPELVEIGRKLVADTDRLVARIVGMIQAIPEYRSVKSGTLWNDVAQVSRAHVAVFIEAVIRGRNPSDKDVRAACYFARRRVHQGVPLRGPLTAYRNGIWILWEELVLAVRGRPALQIELLMRAMWAFRYLDIVTSAISEAYYAEQHGRAQHRDRTLRDLFDEMIGGGTSPAHELKARAEAVGFDLDGSFHFLVLTSATASKRVGLPSASVVVAVADAAGVGVDGVISVERNREILLVTPTGLAIPVAVLRANLSEALDPAEANGAPPQIGISGLVSGIEGVRQGYQEAKRAIELGRTLQPNDSVHCYEDYILQDALDSCAKGVGARLIGESLGPLLDLGEPGQRLIETLEAYVRANGHFKQAAGILDVHPNTLTYRMRQIHRLTGLDVSRPEQRLQAELALRLHLAQRRHEPPEPRPPAAAKKALSGSARRTGGAEG